MASYHKSLAGLGAVTAIPSGANPTPLDLAFITSLKFDVNEEDVELDGDGLDVADSFTSKRTVEGEVEVSEWSAKLLTVVTSGVTTGTGSKKGATHSAVVPASPYAITVPQSANWDTDLAVINLTDGKQMTRVASGNTPNTGEYKVTAGVYTFATADQGDTMFIRYRYAAAAAGVEAKVMAAAMGASANVVQLHMYNGTNGKDSGVYFPAARIPGLSAAFAKKEWVKTTLKFKARLSALNELFYSWSPE